VGENNIKSSVGQEQIHGLLFGDKLSWQSIIYDLINTEQLNPWDIDISILANKFLEKVKELEEANFFVSSKVLFAASLLLRIKSEILLNYHLPGLDDILFGKKENKKYVQERIEPDEEVPELVPRTPLPRHRKVTLKELMSALGKAVRTENRRIEKVVVARRRELETNISIPKSSFNLKDGMRGVRGTLKKLFGEKENKISFSEVLENNGGDKVGTFVPLLHLDNSHKILMEQEDHLEEIFIWEKQMHEKLHYEELKLLREEVDSALELEAVEIDKVNDANNNAE